MLENDLHKNMRDRKNDPSVTGFNIGMNIGESAGQTVFHAHIHLIPRRDGGTVTIRKAVSVASSTASTATDRQSSVDVQEEFIGRYPWPK